MKLNSVIVLTLVVAGMMMTLMSTIGTAHDERLQGMDSRIDSLTAHATAIGLYIQSPAYEAQKAIELNQFVYWAAWNGHY